MQPESRKYAYDIQQACELLVEFTAGKSFEDYASDRLLRSGVERQFEVIGEAVSQMLKRDAGLSEHISEARRIVAFRNVLAHAYWEVSGQLVWSVLEDDLPRLRQEVDALLASESDHEPDAEDEAEEDRDNMEAQAQ